MGGWGLIQAFEREECTGVLAGLLCHFVDRNAAQFGYARGDEWDVGTLVSLASVGYGAEIGGVGFEKDMVEGDCFGDFGQSGVFEGDNASDA